MSGTTVLFAFHSLEYLGLLGGLGSFVVRRLGRIPPRIQWANPPMHVAFAVALVGGLGLLVFQHSWLVVPRVAAEALALLLCLRGVPFVAPVAVLAAGLLAISGHATGAGALFVDALHIFSAGMWAGGILALGSLRPPGGWAAAEARVMLARFGRVAVVAFGITALTGVLLATEQLHDVSDLWMTTYGTVLLLKTAGVLAMLALTPAWRRGPFEAYAAVFVVVATGVLAALPLQA